MLKGSHFSPESLARVRAANARTHSGANNWNYGGGNVTAEARAKMSVARKGKKLPAITCQHIADGHSNRAHAIFHEGKNRGRK